MIRYKRFGYNLSVMRQSACLVINPIMLKFAALFYCTAVKVRLYDGPDLKLFILVGRSFHLLLGPKGLHGSSSLLQISNVVVWRCLDFRPSCNTYLFSPCLCFFKVFNLELFVDRDDSLTSWRNWTLPIKCLYHVSNWE